MNAALAVESAKELGSLWSSDGVEVEQNSSTVFQFHYMTPVALSWAFMRLQVMATVAFV